MGSHRVVVVGATGMVGGCALRRCLDDAEVAQVTAVGRRSVGFAHPKLREVRLDDFLDWTGMAPTLAGHDVALYCLGVYTGAVPDDELRRITVDYTIACAEALREASPGAALCFLSGQGADQSGTSRIAFARAKGAAETALLEMGFPRLHIFRPGYIYPVTPRTDPNRMYRALRLLWPVLRRLWPNLGISSDDLAWAMVTAGLRGVPDHPTPVLENRDIRAMCSQGACTA